MTKSRAYRPGDLLTTKLSHCALFPSGDMYGKISGSGAPLRLKQGEVFLFLKRRNNIDLFVLTPLGTGWVFDIELEVLIYRKTNA